MDFNGAWIACLIAVAGAAPMAFAGDLEPPGAPTSTPGPEPRVAVNAQNTPGDATAFYRIRGSGSYYLTDSLLVPAFTAPRHGVVIEASDVTLDLNGFTMDGFVSLGFPFAAIIPKGPALQASAILASGSLSNVTIVNGSVRDWDGMGIELGAVNGGALERIRVSACGVQGARLGANARAIDSRFSSNAAIGFSGGRGTQLIRCTLENNRGGGASLSQESLVAECVFRNNDSVGLAVEGDTVVHDCTASGNESDGITHGPGSGVVIRSCSASRNGAHGIDAGSGCLIIDNTCVGNGGDTGTVGAGINLKGEENVVRDNLVRGNEIGINYPLNGGNVVYGNTALDNSITNYSSATTGNQIGPVGNASTATSPWANFED